MDCLVDSTFLIDFWRERRRGRPAVRYVEAHANATIGVPWVVKGEFLSGARYAFHDTIEINNFLSPFPTIHSTEAPINRYAPIFCQLKTRNQMIGLHDIWIRATALELDCPLLSRNKIHFSKIPDLKLVDYTPF